MHNASKKVIILNKLSSPYVSEAIIILKDGAAAPQSRLIEEAENIVRNYMSRSAKSGQPFRRTVRTHTWKMTAVLCAGAALASFFTCCLLFR